MNSEYKAPREIAAIDLGSNSFHMVVARIIGNSLQIISRHKQRVRLASGLDSHNNLNQTVMQQGLQCLAMFAERLQDFPQADVRIAATYTLRQAKNAHIFLKRAEHYLPYPIEIIPGTEEARLIYLGVAHTHESMAQKLVIDIGGGSTELIIGSGFTPQLLYSKHMGCVSYSQRFFADGKLNKRNFHQAQLAAKQKLESIAEQYRALGWQFALGSSGTIKAIREVLDAQNPALDEGDITLAKLNQLIDQMIKYKKITQLDLPGLSADRQPVFAAGVAILSAIFQELNIATLSFSNGALREGLLYEMESRFRQQDIRTRTAKALAKQYHVDVHQATRVKETALYLYRQLTPSEDNNSELTSLLNWAALLHEVGLSISYPGFHRHSSYLLRYSTMPGFNLEQQTLLATLARFQRKSLKLTEMAELSLYSRKQIYPMIRALRLAVIFNGQRRGLPHPTIHLKANQQHWHLTLPSEWLKENQLLEADLIREQAYWHKVNWQLSYGQDLT
ncbi:exopolyphosphatase [Photobacterium damselae]|uniref:exopolyphosphatase n=1 Tax=Photobacterium damselae TaxID=38293 RepID=UPI00406924C8